MNQESSESLSGGCLCGGVRYRIDGECRDIVCCHCENCRRTHGHFAAYTAVHESQLTLLAADSLRWYHDESPDTQRGFCNRCGASLFWKPHADADSISVSAGSLDQGGGLKVVGHIFLSEAGSYYRVDDGLPGFDHGSGGAFDRPQGG